MKLIKSVINAPSKYRRLILIGIDAVLLILSFLIFRLISSSQNYSIELGILLILIIGIPVFFFLGQYKGILRFYSSREFYYIILRNFIIALLFFSILTITRVSFFYINDVINLWILFTISISISRIIFRDIIIYNRNAKRDKTLDVVIYGAGSAGALLLKSILLESKYKVRLFVDDDYQLCGRNLNGIPIENPRILKEISNDIKFLFLAIPSLQRNRKKEILDSLLKFNFTVLKIPSIKEIISNKSKISDLRPIEIEDLLDRKKIDKNIFLLENIYKNSTVLVTGAGGSIGSEICRQILDISPKKLILLDVSELNLYNINQELELKYSNKKIIYPILGSASDENLIKKIFKENKIDFVFHAAAYKHVPLVEINPISGLMNNIISTKLIAEYSYKYSIKKMVLVSSDKAVRPTNVMGASKRISELIIQAYAEKTKVKEINNKPNNCCFTMVRFGNVLWSSGSVAPLFREQILSGGPITLTHNDVTRYFMSINEATNLVLQSACIAEGGEVFLLDMGIPFQIRKLAEKMIRLSGLQVKDNENPKGDIEIVTTGLRPGEKLYEELLIDSDSIPTSNKQIFKAFEKHIPHEEFWPILSQLEKYLINRDLYKSFSIVSKLVPKWQNSQLDDRGKF
tara:strand:+ start:738 stop:2627 length:1890 start_codon:yes stop_codon:yes gene_type:complete